MNAVGIDVSKGKSMVAALPPCGSIRKVKTDKADAMKIAKYGLDNWVDLREYTPMDTVRQQLKLCSRQYNLYMKTVVSLQNNLIIMLRLLRDKCQPHKENKSTFRSLYLHASSS